MSIGKMTSFIDIGIFKNVKDEEGFANSVYEAVASVRGYREGRHGSQKWANLAAFSEATDMFRIRFIPGVEITTDTFFTAKASNTTLFRWKMSVDAVCTLK